MEKADRDAIILLFDYWNRGSQDLFESFKNAGKVFHAIVINDDGFLPEGVTNVFEHFLGEFQGEARYFNQIPVPDYWEISANNTNGSIHDKSKERGRIFFAHPAHNRLVKVVDYLDEEGNVRCSEHYNKFGALYARTSFNKKSQKVTKSYFNAKGQEIVVENYVTNDIILEYEGRRQIFKGRTEFVCFFIKLMGWDTNRLFFNSLSVPFFVSNGLPALDGENGKQDILFWQEKTGEEIPGNMQVILQGKAKRCGRIIVQNHPSYLKLLELGVDSNRLSELGFIYSFKKQNRGRKEALICTNTENVEKLKEIAEALPELKIHVTAITEMSGKLLAHEKYENVIMYPNVKAATLDRLFMQCDFYLDINHEGEICEATRRAFIHQLLILAFEETKHGAECTASENVFGINCYENLIHRLKELLADKETLKNAVSQQLAAGLTVTETDYNF
ncbi:accessory Sec system glycosylation chaperone GtfB [Pseudobutyrivibrio xylanivorans]|uniref:UDP-N-acetylglucosamine--peptide N-acetylglucosaminyltransferase stabilizing protein GtfB n=1 Tax=Pseudobutyrivibrio xylanivorans TaxID=185007 RepID=A0A5P6VTZ8_PSEXY|nr:accessory Sec system glycosylation chaperone GtfB [Pseudobutyrivibrio xylanivorans]QFJ55229.1 glycosyl transferase family 8 [Pseudobutyrivibrio xylanivorans]